jgi:hypothetical protein
MAPPDQSLRTIIRHQWIVPVVLPVVMLLALGNWILRPDEALRWLRAMLMLPGLWLGMMLWQLWTLESRRRRGVVDQSDIVRYFGSTMSFLFLAVGLVQIVLLGLAMWVQVEGHRADLDVAHRILGLAHSAVFIIVGNALPKILTPLSMLPREQAQLVTIARRFSGTTLVILGLLTALAFLSVPLPLARTLLLWAVGAGLLTILGAIVWMNVSAVRREG